MFFGHDQSFWTAAGGAALVRIITAEYHGPWYIRLIRAAAMVFTAIFAAVVFTKPLCSFLALPLDTYEIPIAALVALTGEGLMRMAIRATGDMKFLIEAFKIWRGK